MKFSIRLSNAGLAVLAGIVTAFCLLSLMLILMRPVTRVVSSSSSDRVEAREFVLRDSQGRERVRIAVDDNDAPGITLLDKSGTRRAMLRLNGDDVPSLRMYNERGTVDSVMGYNLPTMQPGIFFNGRHGGHHGFMGSEGSVSSFKPFLDEDLYPDWRSHVPFQTERSLQEWHIVPNAEPFQLETTLETTPDSRVHVQRFEFRSP